VLLENVGEKSRDSTVKMRVKTEYERSGEAPCIRGKKRRIRGQIQFHCLKGKGSEELGQFVHQGDTPPWGEGGGGDKKIKGEFNGPK